MARQVAHEIKNPLTPMRLSAQLLQRARRDGDPRWPELADRLARTVQAQTDALAAIAAEFRQFAGPKTSRRERVAIGPLLEEVTGLLRDAAAEQGIAVELRGADDGETAVDGDPQELRRVFLNLIQNGLEARGTRVRVDAHAEAGHVEVAVTDDGAGVPEEARARLFEPYFTSKSSGTGLGLAICKRIVEAHGGSIALHGSRPGETTFAVRLPRAGDGAVGGADEHGGS
jgi:signal transduction histidine kinase